MSFILLKHGYGGSYEGYVAFVQQSCRVLLLLRGGQPPLGPRENKDVPGGGKFFSHSVAPSVKKEK